MRSPERDKSASSAQQEPPEGKSEILESIMKGIGTLVRLAVTSLDYSAIRSHLERGDAPWFLGSFIYFMKFVEEDAFYIEFSRKGIDMFVTLSKSREKEHPEKVGDRVVETNLAKMEQERGYPGLFARHAVALWNMLDATLSESIVQLLLNDKECFHTKSFEKIKLTVSEYETLPRAEFVRLIVAQLKQHHASLAQNSKGIRIYENIYRELGLSKQLSDDDDRVLAELRAVRNAIVHNMSIVDERMLRECRWLKHVSGAPLLIDETAYNKYKGSASAYVLGMISQYSNKYAPWMTKE